MYLVGPTDLARSLGPTGFVLTLTALRLDGESGRRGISTGVVDPFIHRVSTAAVCSLRTL